MVTTALYMALMFFLCSWLGLVGAGLALLIASLTNLVGQVFVVEKWLRRHAVTA